MRGATVGGCSKIGVAVIMAMGMLSGCAQDSPPSRSMDQGSAPTARQSQTFTAGNGLANPPLRNTDSGGDGLDTSMLVMSGDQLTIQPLAITRLVSALIAPVLKHEDNVVCLKDAEQCSQTTPIIQQQCQNVCHEEWHCGSDSAIRPMLGCRGQLHCTPSCQDVHTGDQCVAWTNVCVNQQNQWTETTEYGGMTPPASVVDNSPMSSPTSESELLSGLTLRFFWMDGKGGSKQTDCPLSAFAPTTDGAKFSLTLSDVPGCPPLFKEHPEIPRDLQIINTLSEPIPYQDGMLIKTWDGQTLERPDSSVYHTEIDLSLSISDQVAPQ